jgi:hypothetical protein
LRDPREAQFADINLIAPKYNHRYVQQASKTSYEKNLSYQAPDKHEKYTNTDIKLIQAVQQPNTKFNIEEYLMVPTNDFSESLPINNIVRPSTQEVQNSLRSQKLELRKRTVDDEEEKGVKVESEGRTSADQPFPNYNAYFPRTVYTQEGVGEESTLILEPNSKAVSGNDGTSISTPLSRALLRKGVAVRVLFKPESVAISGAGGTSHAQADLILDFINE